MMSRTRIDITPHLDYAELTQRYRRCRDVKERTRWLVIRLLSRPSNPMKVEQVALITGLSGDWVRKIARRYNVCIWPLLRERLANKVFDTLDSLETVLIERCQWLMNNPTTVKGEVGFSWLCSI